MSERVDREVVTLAVDQVADGQELVDGAVLAMRCGIERTEEIQIDAVSQHGNLFAVDA